MAKSNLKYMIGTEGRPEYLVLEERDKTVLGLKAVSIPMPDKHLGLAVRIRAAIPSGDVIDQELPQDYNTTLWNIQFDQNNAKRSSTIIMMILRGVDYRQSGEVYKAANSAVVYEVLQFLEDRGIRTDVGIRDIRKHLVGGWLKAFGYKFEEAKKYAIVSKSKPRLVTNILYADQLEKVIGDIKKGKASKVEPKDLDTIGAFKKKDSPPALKVIEGPKGDNVVPFGKGKKAPKPDLKVIKKAAKKPAKKKAPAKKAKAKAKPKKK